MVVLEGVSFLNARWNPSIVTKLVSDESLHFFAFLRGGIGTCVTHSSRLLFLRFLLLLFRYFRRIILEIETEIILVCFLLFGRCYPEWEQCEPCWLSTAWAAYATFSEAVQRCHQHTGENFRKRNTLRSSLDFCAKTKKSGRVLGHPAAFTLTRQSKTGHTQYAFSGPNTQLRANYGVRPNYGPITGQLLGFGPNTQLFMLGQ